MTCRARFDMTGLQRYMEDVAALGQDVDQAASEAVEAEGDIFLSGMIADAPQLTGRLSRTLTRTAPSWNGNEVSVIVGMPNDAPAEVARYGNAQEYGYRRGGKQYPPQSYVRRAFDTLKAKALAAAKAIFQAKGLAS